MEVEKLENYATEIDLEKLDNYLWAWFYEGYGRGIDSALSDEDAQTLYDCMVIIKQLRKNNQRVFIHDISSRPIVKGE